jgi:hypothetical protein
MFRRIVRTVLLLAVAVLIGAQFFQPDRTNPQSDPNISFHAVAQRPGEVTGIVNRACRDCHSNETVWPWYSKVAPVSWMVAQDVQEGRIHLNFSEWGRLGPEMASSRLKKVCEEVRGGGMPLWYYLPLHPEAKLTQSEIGILCSGDAAARAAY